MARTRYRVRETGYADPPKRTVIEDDLEGGSFEPPSPHVLFEGVVARNVDFSGLNCWKLSAVDSLFEDCNFSELSVDHGPLALPPSSRFVNCAFADADFRTLEPGHAIFEGCVFDGARIHEWFAYCAEFVSCTFRGATIVRSKFSGKPFECFGLLELRRRRRNRFEGNDFRNAELVDTAFVGGIDLDQQLLPDGEDYVRINNARAKIRSAKLVVENWPDPEAKEEALGTLDALATTAQDQRDIFTRRDTFELPPAVDERLWPLLLEMTSATD